MSFSERSIRLNLRSYLRSNPQYLFNLKTALEKLFREADEKVGEDIIDLIQEIENKLEAQTNNLPDLLGKSRFETFKKLYLDEMVLENFEGEKKLLLAKKLLRDIHRTQSKCSYCGKMIPRGQDTCDWCGHKRDDDEGGFFPYPYLFKPPGGGGGSMKEPIAVSVKTRAQT